MKVKENRREKEVLALYALGLTGKQIADELGIAISTVREYQSRIRARYEVSSRYELVNLARIIEAGKSIETP